MATNIKGPAIFLAQFAGDAAPFNSWDSITKWAASLGYKGVQIPTWDGRLFDLKKAADSKTYADEVLGIARQIAAGLEAAHHGAWPSAQWWTRYDDAQLTALEEQALAAAHRSWLHLQNP